MRKAFTLAEALITIAILGVLAAILIPVINDVRPDKDKITYKKALYSVQSAISTAMESDVYTMTANSAAYWGDKYVKKGDFCKSVAEALNTSGKVDCTTYPSSYDYPNFITTDGIRFWGLEDDPNKDRPEFYTSKTRDICVDRKMSVGERERMQNLRNNNGECDGGLKIQIRYDGKISTPDSSENTSYTYENDLIEDSFNVQQKARDEIFDD